MRWHYLLLGSITVATAGRAQLAPNMKYDGRPTLARLKYTPVAAPDACQGSDSPAGPGWGHDYPISVHALMKAITSLTSIQAANDSNVVLMITDPEVMKYPLLMLTEPGCWDPTDAEVKALRSYLVRGGFLIADDFTFFTGERERCDLAIQRFETWIKRVLPKAEVVRIAAEDPVFNGLFKIDPTIMPPFCEGGGSADLVGIYENNDPTQRLMVVGTYRATLGEAWRYSGDGLGSGIEGGGAAYRIGLNYFIYGLSH